MQIKLDGNGYFYSPFITSSVLLYIMMQKDSGMQLRRELPPGHEAVKKMRSVSKYFDLNTFYDFAVNHGDTNDTNELLMKYHLYRFINSGSITYKIRPKMIDFFESSNLDYPAKLFLPPFRQFMISLPAGYINIDGFGNMLNIYCSEEPFNEKAYNESDDQYSVEKNMIHLVRSNPGKINRVLRCYAVCYNKNLSFESGKTIYYQFPILEDEKIYTQFMNLINTMSFTSKEPAIKMFDIVLKFCSYLIGSKNPDVQMMPGSIRMPSPNNAKKVAAASKHNETEGYDYFDVGRICQSRPSEVEYIRDAHGVLKKHFKVRRHFRAQWYGPKTDMQPNGTHQEIIVIEEFEKGPDIEMKPRMITA